MSAIVFWFRNLLFLVIVLYYKAISVFYKKQNQGTLVIKLEKIGDFVLYSAYQNELVENFQRVSLIVAKPNDQLVDRELYNKVYVFSLDAVRANVFLVQKWFEIFKKIRFERLILFSHSPSFFHFGLSLLISASKKTVSSSDQLNSRVTKYLMKTFFDPILITEEKELSKNKEFVQGIIGKQLSLKLADFNFVEQIQVSISEKFVAVAPTASWEKRAWNKEKFVALIDQIINETGYQVVLFGAPNEVDYCELIKSECSNSIINLSGKLSLSEYASYLKSSRAFIGNESGAAHLAYVQGVDVICITGGGHYGRFVPYPSELKTSNKFITVEHKMNCYNCNWNCIYDTHELPCIREIEVEQVFNEIRKILH